MARLTARSDGVASEHPTLGAASGPGRLDSSGADWTRFGWNAARSNAATDATGIESSNVATLRRQVVPVDGTVDASAIYLHDVQVRGAAHDALFVTTAGAADLFTAPAAWRRGQLVWLYVADADGLDAWLLSRGRLRLAWHSDDGGTSPARLDAARGHWNSPIIVDGMVVLPVGNANDHRTSGEIDIYRLP